MDGLLIVDKPEGLTSADVVRRVKHRFGCKTGHLGTLDPFATGVLPLCLGEATKIAQFLNAADKAYIGRVRLGIATDSGDSTGTITTRAAVPKLQREEIQTVQDRFVGESDQVPPMFSAVKRDGKPLYKLARLGIEVDRRPRRICVHSLRLELLDATTMEIEVHCSKGTYVRVLAEEIATALGTVGHLEHLRRTRFGLFDIVSACSLDAAERGSVNVVSMRDSLAGVAEVCLDPTSARRARQGYAPLLADLPKRQVGELAKLIAPDGSLVAVIGMQAIGGWQYLRVLGSESSAAA